MFVAFYACCIPIALWRLIKYPTARTWILVRPALVIALRIAGNVLRYMEATSDSLAPNKGRIVAEQVSVLLVGLSRPRKLILLPFGADPHRSRLLLHLGRGARPVREHPRAMRVFRARPSSWITEHRCHFGPRRLPHYPHPCCRHRMLRERLSIRRGSML